MFKETKDITNLRSSIFSQGFHHQIMTKFKEDHTESTTFKKKESSKLVHPVESSEAANFLRSVKNEVHTLLEIFYNHLEFITPLLHKYWSYKIIIYD